MMTRDFTRAALFILILAAVYVYTEEAKPQIGVFTYDAKGKRDPLMPMVDENGNILRFSSTPSSSEMHLEGIAYSKAGDRYAVINSTVYREKDLVGDYRVISIQERKAILIKGQKEFVLELEKLEEE